jgi:hypothetical protein
MPDMDTVSAEAEIPFLRDKQPSIAVEIRQVSTNCLGHDPEEFLSIDPSMPRNLKP